MPVMDGYHECMDCGREFPCDDPGDMYCWCGSFCSSCLQCPCCFYGLDTYDYEWEDDDDL